jgi:sirohydrochlorin ferrochelatase
VPAPKVVTKTEIPPEHNFSLKYDEWELVVFDNAISYTVMQVLGGGNRNRQEFSDLPTALNAARDAYRTCVYAVTSAGRSIVLDRAQWPKWIARYKINNGLLVKRPITQKKRKRLLAFD